LTGVSFVIPVHNGEPWLPEVLEAILAQADGRPMEIIVVDDDSRDASAAIARRYGAQILSGGGRGAAAAVNLGLERAQHPIVCQVDQDVVVGPGWMSRLAAELDDPLVAAAQGWYETDRRASLWARVMGLELEQRYRRISGRFVDHVCTGNTAYRKEALRAIGGFDERLGYGYDNDVSYRLGEAGYKLAFCREAKSVHRWREDLRGYLRQQYGFGFGRIDLVAKHRRRVSGDQVSPLSMMLHAPLLFLALLLLLGSSIVGLLPGLLLLACLAVERLWATFDGWRQFRDPATLWFLPAHLLRDLAWVAALLAWTSLRLRGRGSVPGHSMNPRKVLAEALSAGDADRGASQSPTSAPPSR
jgi:cellulose synthase/poly-beta-1,6-N-acetylglucosamine synthase-like glycosyltransferase